MNQKSPPSANDPEVAALRAIVAGTARNTGQEFFQTLVRHLAEALNVEHAFVAEFVERPVRVRTVAWWAKGRITENIEFALDGTPCSDVYSQGYCHYAEHVQNRFPHDADLIELGIESYLGVPLLDADEKPLGHLAVFDPRPMPAEPRFLFTFQIFAARAAAELERLRAEKMLRDSEQRYRNLYDEAPIAYVHEDLDSHFISANRAAMRILGITPEQVSETFGMSLVPDNPEAQRRAKEALASVGRGADTSGVVLEIRRKDNGKPTWIQWWSKPDRDGKSTRTMFVDITEQVLAEQEKARLHQQNIYLQEEIKAFHNFEEIIGQSPALTNVLENVERVAATDTTVLITGETGTGKELIARAIHSSSKRKHKPLIKVNCAALPTGLVESELFGHEKGAFTGAIAKRVGRFELAEGGTIFLDEIGEVPLEAQIKLLRVLQEREFERVGGAASIKVDVRVLAATNRDLLKAVREKTFREDLYYRLGVFPVALPPLRNRPGDIPLLTQFLINKFSNRIGKRIHGISQSTMQRLLAYAWPGNVRELENVLERAVILANSDLLEIGADTLAGPSAGSPSPPANLEQVEKTHIVNILRQTSWVIEGPAGAAKILGLHPNTLRSRLKRYGITRDTHEPS
jgi:formate hydrogenlyase transcriptional activator